MPITREIQVSPRLSVRAQHDTTMEIHHVVVHDHAGGVDHDLLGIFRSAESAGRAADALAAGLHAALQVPR